LKIDKTKFEMTVNASNNVELKACIGIAASLALAALVNMGISIADVVMMSWLGLLIGVITSCQFLIYRFFLTSQQVAHWIKKIYLF